jgi:WD40 repeat protein
VTRKAKSCLGAALGALVLVLGLSAFAGYREWRARQPFVLDDPETSFFPRSIHVGGRGVIAALDHDAPLGSDVVQGSMLSIVRLYSIDARSARRTLRDPEDLPIHAFAISPSGDFVATVVGKDVTERTTVRLWRVATGDVAWSLELGSVRSDWPGEGGGLIDFALEGDRLVTRNASEIQIVDVPTGQVLRRIRPAERSTRGLVTFLRRGFFAYRDRERRGNPEHETLQIYAEELMSLVRSIPIAVNGWATFSRSRRHFAQLDGGFHVWELPGCSETAVLSVESVAIRFFDFSRDDDLLAAAVEDSSTPGTATTIRCWSLPEGRNVPIVARAPKGVCTGLAFAPDRNVLVAVYEGKIHVYPYRR